MRPRTVKHDRVPHSPLHFSARESVSGGQDLLNRQMDHFRRKSRIAGPTFNWEESMPWSVKNGAVRNNSVVVCVNELQMHKYHENLVTSAKPVVDRCLSSVTRKARDSIALNRRAIAKRQQESQSLNAKLFQQRVRNSAKSVVLQQRDVQRPCARRSKRGRTRRNRKLCVPLTNSEKNVTGKKKLEPRPPQTTPQTTMQGKARILKQSRKYCSSNVEPAVLVQLSKLCCNGFSTNPLLFRVRRYILEQCLANVQQKDATATPIQRSAATRVFCDDPANAASETAPAPVYCDDPATETVATPVCCDEPAVAEPETAPTPVCCDDPAIAEPDTVATPVHCDEPAIAEPDTVATPVHCDEPAIAEPDTAATPVCCDEPVIADSETAATPVHCDEPAIAEPDTAATPVHCDEPAIAEPDTAATSVHCDEPSIAEPDTAATPVHCDEPAVAEPDTAATPVYCDKPAIAEPDTAATPVYCDKPAVAEPDTAATPVYCDEPAIAKV